MHSTAEVARILTVQRDEGVAINADEAGEIVETEVRHFADMQFRGQTHLIRVAVPSPGVTREQLQALFEDAYFARFEVRLPEIRAVLVNLHTAVVGRRRPMDLKGLLSDGTPATTLAGARIGERRLYFDGGYSAALVCDRGRLPADARIAGPAIVEQLDATTYIPADARAAVDPIGNLIIGLSP